MKITDVTVKRYGRMQPVAEMAAGSEVLVVEVQTDEGVSGSAYTSANVSRHGSTGDIAAMIIRRTLKNIVLGEDPLLTDQVWRKMYAGIWRLGRRGLAMQCLGAVDCALWDIKGKRLGVPVSTLFGGHRERIPTYVNAGHQLPPDKLAEKAAEYVKLGHRAVKIRGSATAVSLREANARVAAVREAIGPDVKLMVDVNGTFDVDTAIQQLKVWEPYDLYWFEEPVQPEDIEGYVRVRERAGSTYIAGGEQHSTMFEFRQLIEQGAVDIVQPNANVTGGITEWLRVHAFATAHSLPVSPWDLQPVHIHMAAGLANVMWIEYFLADNPLADFQNRLFNEPKLREVRGDDGVFLLPPEKPGLGIELDESLAEQTLIKE